MSEKWYATDNRRKSSIDGNHDNRHKSQSQHWRGEESRPEPGERGIR
jgi:hypothetical protein